VAAAGFQVATYVAPIVITVATTPAGVAIAVDSALAYGATTDAPTSDLQPNAPSNAPPLDWGGAPFDVGLNLMNAPLCGIESEDESSDDDSIFIDLSRD
jgi:hypothetical protein